MCGKFCAAILRWSRRASADLKLAIAHCEKVRDFVTRELFVDILENEEEHIDWLQTQFRLIEQMGLENYVTAPDEAEQVRQLGPSIMCITSRAAMIISTMVESAKTRKRSFTILTVHWISVCTTRNPT